MASKYLSEQQVAALVLPKTYFDAALNEFLEDWIQLEASTVQGVPRCRSIQPCVHVDVGFECVAMVGHYVQASRI